MEAFRPLVVSVCRRHLVSRDDIDDAVQETFTKLALQADKIHNLMPWLHRVAYTACVDIIRKQGRERSRIESFSHHPGPDTQRALARQMARHRLPEALGCLDEPSRTLLQACFLYNMPMRVIAGIRDVSVATISRHVQRAVGDLGAVLRDMGIDSLDSDTLSACLMEAGQAIGENDDDGGGLRLGADWHTAPQDDTHRIRTPTSDCLPGWSRPIRVGVYLSYQSIFTPNFDGWHMPVEYQVKTLKFSSGMGFQYVGLVEPGTSAHAPIERTLRDYGITAGLIDITDVDSLLSLDAIYLGWSYATSTAALEATASAVSQGVGLYNEHFTSQLTTDMSDPRMRRLMLSRSEIGFSHATPCISPRWATYHKRHPAFPGISAGTTFLVSGCGPLYKPVRGAEILMTRNDISEPNDLIHSMAVSAMRIPALVVGELGRGRVIVLNVLSPEGIFRHTAYQGDYLANIFQWLAEPRQEFVQSANRQDPG